MNYHLSKKSQFVRNKDHRRKIYSLRLDNSTLRFDDEMMKDSKDEISRLQKSLQKDNQEEQPVSEPQMNLPDDQMIKIEEMYWKRFHQKSPMMESKVERQMLNLREKQFLNIRRDHQLYIFTTKDNIVQLKNILKDKYNQIHSFFQEIKQEKISIASNLIIIPKAKKHKQKQSQVFFDNNMKIVMIKQTIQSLRVQAAEIQNQVFSLEKKIKVWKKQWIFFLKKLIIEGIYMKQGLFPIVQQLAKTHQNLQQTDLPKVLDSISKSCILRQFQKIKYQNQQKLRISSSSSPRSDFKNITKNKLIRQVYHGTKDYISYLVKNSKWKQLTFLPPIRPQNTLESHKDWRQRERLRINYSYEGQAYQQVKRILFGVKVQTCK